MTDSDVERLAQMLFANFRSGGAEVAVSFEHGEGLNVTVEGVIDWADHQGSFEVTSTGAQGQRVDEVRFSEDAVYEPLDQGQVAALDAQGRSGARWSVRAPEPTTRPIDQVIALVVSLAATRPDNPALVAQRGLAFDGTEQVGSIQADRFTSSESGAVYWLEPSSGRLIRFQGTLAGFASPVVVEMTGHGPVEVDLPTDAVAVSELPD